VDAIHRRRRALLIGLVVLAAACASRAPGTPVGTSDRGPRGSRPGGADGGFIDGSGSLPGPYRSTFTKVRARFVSQGHAAGRWEIDVWANEAAAKALAARARTVPVGAIVVAEHYERNEARAAGPVFVMEKRAAGYAPDHGDYRYVVVGSQGQLVGEGVVESCAGCHDDAPMDGFFPLAD
jgi:hypothetical protein